jgi:hypothetical protein
VEGDDVRDRVRQLIVTGDNRIKQDRDGHLRGRARASFEEALALAEQHGIADERLRAIIARRLEAVAAAPQDQNQA